MNRNDIFFDKEAALRISNNLAKSFSLLVIVSSKFVDNPKLLNTPRDFTVVVKDVNLSNGAGFIVAYLGSVLTMPGLPKVPQAIKMEDENE